MKKLLFTLMLFIGANLLHAQKTAYFNERELLKAIPGYEKQIKVIDSIKQNYTEKIKANSDKLNIKVEELLKPYNLTEQITQEELLKKLSEKDKERFELIQDEQKLNEKIAKSLEKEYNTLYQEKVGKLVEIATVKIENYCKSKKIEVLIKLDILGQGIGYLQPSLNITEELKKAVVK